MTAARLNRLLAASPSLFLGILVAKFWISGTLRYFVNDRTVWVVLAGGGLFALVGLRAVYLAWHSAHEPGSSWRTLVFLVPILIGLLVPARPLSVTSGQASSLGSLQLASHVSSGDPGDTFGVWIGDLSAHPDPNWWTGQHVTLVGFVARQAGLPRRGFIVGRYLVTCCVVDASLLGFPVQLDRGPIPAEGAWIQVSGRFGSHYWTDPSGAHYPLVEHARVMPVSIPSSPYLSP
jgi:uncharacterized repeat protein (TIGR03943 family)